GFGFRVGRRIDGQCRRRGTRRKSDGACPCGQGLGAVVLQHDDVPGLTRDVAAQVPTGRIAVEVLALQRRGVTGRDGDVELEADLTGERLKDAGNATPGMWLVRVGAACVRERGAGHRRRQIPYVVGVVAQNRIDATEGEAVAYEE